MDFGHIVSCFGKIISHLFNYIISYLVAFNNVFSFSSTIYITNLPSSAIKTSVTLLMISLLLSISNHMTLLLLSISWFKFSQLQFQFPAISLCFQLSVFIQFVLLPRQTRKKRHPFPKCKNKESPLTYLLIIFNISECNEIIPLNTIVHAITDRYLTEVILIITLIPSLICRIRQRII